MKLPDSNFKEHQGVGRCRRGHHRRFTHQFLRHVRLHFKTCLRHGRRKSRRDQIPIDRDSITSAYSATGHPDDRGATYLVVRLLPSIRHVRAKGLAPTALYTLGLLPRHNNGKIRTCRKTVERRPELPKWHKTCPLTCRCRALLFFDLWNSDYSVNANVAISRRCRSFSCLGDAETQDVMSSAL